MTRKPTQIAGAFLRNVAAIITHAADHMDPPPPVHAVWPFTIQTGTATKAAEARITWHGHLTDSDFKETC